MFLFVVLASQFSLEVSYCSKLNPSRLMGGLSCQVSFRRQLESETAITHIMEPICGHSAVLLMTVQTFTPQILLNLSKCLGYTWQTQFQVARRTAERKSEQNPFHKWELIKSIMVWNGNFNLEKLLGKHSRAQSIETVKIKPCSFNTMHWETGMRATTPGTIK